MFFAGAFTTKVRLSFCTPSLSPLISPLVLLCRCFSGFLQTCPRWQPFFDCWRRILRRRRRLRTWPVLGFQAVGDTVRQIYRRYLTAQRKKWTTGNCLFFFSPLAIFCLSKNQMRSIKSLPSSHARLKVQSMLGLGWIGGKDLALANIAEVSSQFL